MANNFSSNASPYDTEPRLTVPAHTDIVACLLLAQSGHAARAARAAISALDPRLTAFGNAIKVPPALATPWACTGCIQLTLPG